MVDVTSDGSGSSYKLMDQPRHDVEAAWREHRQRAFDVAYRMLGSINDAEDVVQEAYARLLRADLAGIGDVRGWLVTVTARLSLDVMRSAAVRRAEYVGPWLPEPVVGSPDPADRVTLDESVRMALLVVLERLSPAERTAFVLHDVFRLPFETIGEIVGRSPSACRQLASRARRHIASSRGRFEPDRDEHRRITESFAAACATGRVQELLSLLDPSAVGEFDSGGQVPHAPTKPIRGASRIARVLIGSFAGTKASFEAAPINGEPGLVIRVAGQVVAVVSLTIANSRVVHLHAVGNPDKLRHLG
jgi:RNA polymerase sigma-70 factor, ECF subfamily